MLPDNVVRIADSWWAGDFECDPREFAVALSRALVTITKGQTSRAEVLALLGPPDIEATEANTKINPSSPLAEYYREGLRHFRTAESDWLALLPYSSLSEDRIALLYTEFDAMVIIVVAPVSGGTGPENGIAC